MKFDVKKDEYGGSYYSVNDDIFTIIPENRLYGSQEDAMTLRVLGLILSDSGISIDGVLESICDKTGFIYYEGIGDIMSKVTSLTLDHKSLVRLHTSYQHSKTILNYYIPQCILLKRIYHSLVEPSDDQIVDAVSFCVSEEFITSFKLLLSDDIFIPYRNYVLRMYHNIVTTVADILVDKGLIKSTIGKDLCTVMFDLVALQGYDYAYQDSRCLVEVDKHGKSGLTVDDFVAHIKKIQDLL